MNPGSSKDVIIRYGWPIKAAILLLGIAALFAFVPPAVRAIPEEAFGPLIFFLSIPGFLVYLSIVVLTYRIRISSDRIATDAFPNPFLRSAECRFADISAVEKDRWWSTLSIFQFQKPEPFRITSLEILDASPSDILNAIQARIGRDIFLERVTNPLRRGWPWHKRLANAILLLGSVWFSLQLLAIRGILSLAGDVRDTVGLIFSAGILLLLLADWYFYRYVNRES
jgi:hypothetical protein